MSNELESIIRPFQSNDITPPQTYFMPGEIGVPNIVLRIGRGGGGGGKTLQGSYQQTATFYMTKYETERVASPFRSSHHSQFIGKLGQGVIGKPMGS
jgi:hypothetical protein